MNIDLIGKRAYVGGASQGIGRACAEALATLGASVIVVARSEEKLEGIAASLSADQGQQHGYLAADYDNPDTLIGKAEDLLDDGPVHILVNNTAGPPGGLIFDAHDDEFELAFRRHLLCNHRLAHLFVPGMREAGYGRIVNIVSTSVYEPIPGLGVSNTIRAAVAGWAKTLADELAPDGITVNNVLPGFTSTERLRSLFESKADKTGKTFDEVEENARNLIPMGRFAEPAEIASMVAFLASPAASYMTGLSIPVDGGRTRSI